MAPVTWNGLRQAGDVFGRVKLGLVIEADRGEHVEREIGLADERSRKTEPLRDFYLLLDLRDIAFVPRVDVSGLGLDIAVDPVLGGQASDSPHGALLRLGIEAGARLPEFLL